MVAIALDHGADVAQRELLPRLIADVLPAGDFLEHEQANLIAAIEEVRRLRVVAGADDVAREIVLEDLRVLALEPRGSGGADVRVRLMTIEPVQLDVAIVEVEAAVVAEFGGAEAD